MSDASPAAPPSLVFDHVIYACRCEAADVWEGTCFEHPSSAYNIAVRRHSDRLLRYKAEVLKYQEKHEDHEKTRLDQKQAILDYYRNAVTALISGNSKVESKDVPEAIKALTVLVTRPDYSS